MKMDWIRITLSGLVLFVAACNPSGTTDKEGMSSENKEAVESKHLVTVTAANFDQQVIKNDKLVMVDFWASWCPPCRAIAPTVSQIADAYTGKVTVGKVNVDNDSDLARKQQVVNIPTIKFYKGGKVVDEVVGLVSKDVLEEKIKQHL